MNAAADPAIAVLEALIQRLHERGRLRVWSLVITIFGDAIVPRGGQVALAALQEIIERLRIEPGALRTAMSRLAKDEWVVRERDGRHSHFRLDERGRQSFDLATRRIYAEGPPAWDGKWTVALAPSGNGTANGSDLVSHGFVRVAGGVYIRPDTSESSSLGGLLDGMLVIHGESAEHPETLRALWPAAEIAAAYSAFIEAFGPLSEVLASGAALGPRDAMAARTLLIHDWRRIVLRDPGLPAALMPDQWPGEDARQLMRTLYATLRPASEAWLDAAGVPQSSR